jgi:hypothetical protein
MTVQRAVDQLPFSSASCCLHVQCSFHSPRHVTHYHCFRIRRESYIPPSEITPFLFLGGIENAGRHDKVVAACYAPPVLHVSCLERLHSPPPPPPLFLTVVQLAELGITHVLNCCSESQVSFRPPLPTLLLLLFPTRMCCSLPMDAPSTCPCAMLWTRASSQSSKPLFSSSRTAGPGGAAACCIVREAYRAGGVHPPQCSPAMHYFLSSLSFILQSLHCRRLPSVARPCFRYHVSSSARARV